VDDVMTTAVDATPDDVWRLFVDVERWPEMTKSVRNVRRLDDGPLRAGSEAIVKQPRLPRARWRVTDLDPGRSFTWETSTGGVTTVGIHSVEADGAAAKVTLSICQRGRLVGVVDAIAGRLARRYLAMELEGFRRTAESAR
jgi:uncharacterized membrane protein